MKMAPGMPTLKMCGEEENRNESEGCNIANWRGTRKMLKYYRISAHINHITLYHIKSCQIISYHIISYHIIPFHTISCHIIQNKINRTLNFATFSDRISSLSPHQSAGSFFRELKDVGSSGTAFRSVEENQKYVE